MTVLSRQNVNLVLCLGLFGLAALATGDSSIFQVGVLIGVTLRVTGSVVSGAWNLAFGEPLIAE